MKNLLLFLSFFTIISLNAQNYDEIIYGNPSFFLLYENEDILITNNGSDVNFAGYLGFRSNVHGSVTIRSELGYVVKIVPTFSRESMGAGTQLGTRPPVVIPPPLVKTTLYPNPSTNFIYIESSANIIGYKIYDSQRTLKSENTLLKSKQFSVNVNNLNPGIYHTIILLDNGQIISKQFIKQ